MYTTSEMIRLRDRYRRELLDNILPFWMKHARDRRAGGYVTCLERDGSVIDYDKLCMWAPGRIIWTYSHLYNELRADPKWLEMARHGLAFVDRYGFAPDGRMYYALTRDGRPLRAASDPFSELSIVQGWTEYARATQDRALYLRAKRLFAKLWNPMSRPGACHPPFDPKTRPVRVLGHVMISINVAQELRRFEGDPEYNRVIDRCIAIIRRYHLKPGKQVLFELVGPRGEQLEGNRGRWINPGHMIEGGLFLIREGQHRRKPEYVRLGVDLIDWGFQWGWDKEYGGIFNDVDCEGKSMVGYAEALIGSSKMWWQHAEALYGTLLAYSVTNDRKFRRAHERVRDYCFQKFSDPEYGEWFAFLDRAGKPLQTVKGTDRKSSFHIARNLHWCAELLDRMTTVPAPLT